METKNKPTVPPRDLSYPVVASDRPLSSNTSSRLVVEPTEPEKDDREAKDDLESDECRDAVQVKHSNEEEYANSFQMKSSQISLERFFSRRSRSCDTDHPIT